MMVAYDDNETAVQPVNPSFSCDLWPGSNSFNVRENQLTANLSPTRPSTQWHDDEHLLGDEAAVDERRRSSFV